MEALDASPVVKQSSQYNAHMEYLVGRTLQSLQLINTYTKIELAREELLRNVVHIQTCTGYVEGTTNCPGPKDEVIEVLMWQEILHME